MKILVKCLNYLPVILLGVAGTIIVVDMWHITESGRKKPELAESKPAPSVQVVGKPSPDP